MTNAEKSTAALLRCLLTCTCCTPEGVAVALPVDGACGVRMWQNGVAGWPVCDAELCDGSSCCTLARAPPCTQLTHFALVRAQNRILRWTVNASCEPISASSTYCTPPYGDVHNQPDRDLQVLCVYCFGMCMSAQSS